MSRGTLLRAPLLLVLLAVLGSTHPAFAEPAWKAGEVLIKFKPNARPNEIAEVRKALRATRIKHFGRIRADHERISGITVEEAVARFRGHPAVAYIEPNYIVHTSAIPNDPRFGELYGMQRISAPQAWDVTTGTDILVGMIDTGVDYTHPDLAANIYTNPGEIPDNGIDDDGNGFIDDVHGWDFANNDNDPMDDNSHGTHTAGTVGAVGNNGIGVAGVCWHVRLLPLKFIGPEGFGNTADGISCIEYATMMHARLTSNSWGGGGYSQALFDAVQDANAAGILFVAAAGNAAMDADQTPFYPSGLDLPNVISVAATNSSDALAGFSNFGVTMVDLAAPGVNNLSTTPNNTYSLGSGTSMACPHVAGALALVLSKYPELSARDARRVILYSVDPLQALRGVVQTGGRLNVARALEGPDRVAPGGILDLAVLSSTSNRIRLGWTASGNNGTVGTALAYDLRYATAPITADTFEGASPFTGITGPAPSGTHQEVTVTGLDANTTYYFALKARDGFDNVSPISNVASGTTLPAPDIRVAPASVAVSMAPEGTETRTITISNPSAGVLDFELGYETTAMPLAASRPPAVASARVSEAAPRTWSEYARDAASLTAPSTSAVATTSSSAATPPLPVVIADPATDGGAVDLTELRAQPDQNDLHVELTFAQPIDPLRFGGVLLVDIDRSRSTGLPPLFGTPDQDIGAEFEIHLFSLAAGKVRVFHAASHTLLGTYPAIVNDRSLRFSIPLFTLGDDDGSMDVVGVVGDENHPTDWLPDTGHGTIRGVRWVSAAPASGTIPPGGSLDLTVTFQAHGLREGTYEGAIRVASNDPDQPELSVAARADVTGLPRMEISPLEFDFGSVAVGGSRTDTLAILNSGTRDLHVSAIVSDQPVFAVGASSLTVAPGERHAVPITFTPTAAGPFSGNLQVTSDDPDGGELFGLFAGSGVPPPNVQMTTDLIAATLRTGETASRPLVLTNTGPGDLVVELSVQSAPVAVSPQASAPRSSPAPGPGSGYWTQTDTTAVEAAILGEPASQIPILVVQDIRAWGLLVGPLIHERFGLPVRVIRSEQLGATDLSRYDLVVTASGQTPAYDIAISTYDTKFAEYVRGGGTVFYQTGTFASVRLAGGARYEFMNFEDQNRQAHPGHPVFAGLPWLLQGINVNVGILTNLPTGTDILAETYLTHLPTMVEYTMGKGRIVVTGTRPEFEVTLGTPLAPLLTQTIAYCLEQAPPRWLRVEPATAVVPPGGSLTAEVRFESGWAAGGTHEARIRVRSNDADQPELLVPVRLDVTPLPDIRLSRPSLDFGALFLNASRTDSLAVSNEGTTTLTVSGIEVDHAAFVPRTGSFDLAPGESAWAAVTFQPTSLGPLTAALRIRSNDPDEAEAVAILSGSGIPAPVVAVAPSRIEITLPLGGKNTRAITLENQGGSEMTFVSEFQAPPGTTAAVTPPDPGVTLQKGEPDTRVGLAALAHVGTPDRFGHTWVDSDELGGPAFEWIEISGIGTKIPFLGDDIVTAPIPIGFSFPYFGASFSTFRIGSNGYISFTSGTASPTWMNLSLPSASAPENMIAPFWDDLFATVFSSTYVHSNGTRTVIQFQDYVSWSGTVDDRFTFQIVLYPSGEFRMQYLSMNGVVNSATVGFQNAARDDGRQVAFNTAYLHDRLAIRVTSRPRWITLDPSAGAVAANGSVEIHAQLDASGLGAGRHDTVLLLHSDDPVTPVVEVPVALQVLAAVDATAMKITPSTIQPRSAGKQIQAFVELPRELDPARVVLSSVRLLGTVPASQRDLKIADFNGNGIPDLAFQFEKSAVVAVLPPGDPVEVTVTGEVRDAALFTGRASIHVVRPQVGSPNGGEILTAGAPVNVRWSVPEEWTAHHADLSYSTDDGATWKVLAQGVSSGEYAWTVPSITTTTGRVRVSLYDASGLLGVDASDAAFTVAAHVTGVDEEAPPAVAALHQNRPNPSNPSTTIAFDLPRESHALLTIQGADGRIVRRLVDGVVAAGRRQVVWDGRDDRGRSVASGVYYYKLTAGTYRASRRMVLLK